MIGIGIAGMGYFLYCLFNPLQVGYAPFYWLLMAGTVFTCLRILHEWYHYFYITVPRVPPPGRPFTVDIFTTFCAGEPYSMIVETLQAIQAIRYPHSTYLCDEANDPYLAEVCRQLGVHHVTRTDKQDAKAGNINNALKQSGGELCVVLDPDHVPLPGFLDPIIPHFNNEEVGFVQVVQAYDNLRDSLIAKGAAQQTFQFYGPMMMTMNRYGTVLAIGANCTFRRTALASIGGHAAGLAEDMHTAMQLHAKGWRSVYVPEVLTYGLVPSTLSAYYKQQLKWARGTFELLVTSFPRLFSKFTWRQRLHYGTIPFHYFSGVIFLINFLVPILSLMLDLIPFRVDLLSFALTGLPFLSATLAIRHFVQRWVMGENERGNHVVGGLLLIGTWWIYILGLVYTIMRKKVPYIPTPKDDSGEDNWRLNIPNAAIAVASLAAIVYGLYRDWNPYTWVMAGIAAMNCAIMLFNIAVSRQRDLRRLRARVAVIKLAFIYWLQVKQQLWHLRHGLYTGIRRFALLLILFVSFTALYFLTGASRLPEPVTVQTKERSVFYTGIFSPAAPGGRTSLQHVYDYQRRYNTHFGIISLYIPWGDEERCYVPQQLLDSIYNNGSYPMITWEPWAALFRQAAGHEQLSSEKKMLARITEGAFDRYLLKFAEQLRDLHRPVYLRFAHEMDNPSYPWSAAGENTPEEFRAAWRHVHDLFIQHKAYNVMWVWSPWKPGAIDDYFPGHGYVDWIGVTCLNYGALNPDGNDYTFKQLYAPFHRHPLFRAGLPVMVAETGSLGPPGSQEQWLNGAFAAIQQEFPEIKATVLFNSDIDSNVPGAPGSGVLNWKLRDQAACFTLATAKFRAGSGQPSPGKHSAIPALAVYDSPDRQRLHLMDTIRGMHYEKGRHWYRNFHALTRREIEKDLTAMQRLGVNVIRRTGPGVYDRNILSVAKDLHMKVHYSFHIPGPDAAGNIPAPDALAEEIMHTVKALKDDKSIMAWNIGDTLWQQLAARFPQPAALYPQQAYMAWLKKLLIRIKRADPYRPVTMDVSMNERLAATIRRLQRQLPEVDAFGLIINSDTAGIAQIKALAAPCFISQVSVPHYLQLPASTGAVFIGSWQDAGERGHLAFNGIVDHWGRYKPAYYQLGARWGLPAGTALLPEVQVLRPAALTKPGEALTYRALLRRQQQWTLAADRAGQDVRFEWRLVRTNYWGQAVAMKQVGSGPSLKLQIPENPAACRLYLVATKGEDVTTALVPLQIAVR
ncbi:hypothetical protein GCM10009415_14230 [Chitinophaga japonensis]